MALGQVKVRVDDPHEHTALWTIANHTILEKVAAKEREVSIVRVWKLLGGDLVVQLKDREGKQTLATVIRDGGYRKFLLLHELYQTFTQCLFIG